MSESNDNSQPSFAFGVFFSRSSGHYIDLLSLDDVTPELRRSAEEIAHHYVELLRVLFVENSTGSPGYRSIQDGFTAACEGLSVEEWEALSADKQDELRRHHCSFYSPLSQYSRQPPSIVIYIGGPQNTLAAPPSVAAALASGSSANLSDVEPWDPVWDNAMNTAELPVSWGWHTRDRKVSYNTNNYIFISGLYALWPLLWGKELRTASRVQMEKIRVTHLKVVLFHELIHAARSLLHGLMHLTPLKCIDHSENAKSDGGKAGRLGEKIAFGTVVCLSLCKGKLLIFECENNEDRTPFEIQSRVWENLFHVMGCRLPVNEPRRDLSIFIPMNERYKAHCDVNTSEVDVRGLPVHYQPILAPAIPRSEPVPPEVLRNSLGFPNLIRCVVSDWRLGIRGMTPELLAQIDAQVESAGKESESRQSEDVEV
ncbi:hypothetical protein GYMLUDRAFT_236982 [Collybiopsis luxurians FD-317 M1]|nr:hypothetical protein GYMLUDRAFT_236982 [Collybiopsis luxurians FD-317 M1]